MRAANRSGIAFALVMLAAAALANSVLAGDNAQDEYAIKAALIYNFMKFTEWPASQDDSTLTEFHLVVYGEESLAKSFSGLEGKVFKGKRIRVTVTRHPEDASGCQLLFLVGNQRDDWVHVLAVLGDLPVLTVGEMPGFLEAGGIINLHLAANRIRFEVNLDQARARRLSISSRLLKLASLVINSSEGSR